MDAKSLVVPATLKVPKPAAPKFAHTVVVGEIAERLVEIEMLRNNIMPCKPVIDIGVDRVTYFGDILKRVQIKGQEADAQHSGRLTFCTRRRKVSPTSAISKSYGVNELDAFVFVHTELLRFFVVPASAIGPTRHKITFGPNSHSKWQDAWWVLKQVGI